MLASRDPTTRVAQNPHMDLKHASWAIIGGYHVTKTWHGRALTVPTRLVSIEQG